MFKLAPTWTNILLLLAPMSFSQIPLDIILELTHLLDLEDSVHLIATCKTFQAVLGLKELWVKALQRLDIVHRRPLPFPIGYDPAALSLESVREKAILAYTLKRNWTSDHPAPTSVRQFEFTTERRFDQIHTIPGTRLVMTSSHERLVCWDTLSGVCVGCFDYDSKALTHVALGVFELTGQCFSVLVFVSPSDALEWIVVRIDYDQGETETRMTEVYSSIWDGFSVQDMRIEGVALDEKRIGMVVSYWDDTAALLYSSLHHCDDNIVKRVPLPTGNNEAILQCMLHDAHFYIARQREHATFVEVSRIEASLPSHPGDVPINTVKTAIPSYSRGTFFDYAFQVCPLTAPKYGIFNVTAPFSRVLHPVNKKINSLKFGALHTYEHPWAVRAICTGASGTHALLVEDQEDSAPLTVLHFDNADPTTPHVSACALAYPSKVPIAPMSMSCLAIDDALGEVYVGAFSNNGPPTIYAADDVSDELRWVPLIKSENRHVENSGEYIYFFLRAEQPEEKAALAGMNTFSLGGFTSTTAAHVAGSAYWIRPLDVEEEEKQLLLLTENNVITKSSLAYWQRIRMGLRAEDNSDSHSHLTLTTPTSRPPSTEAPLAEEARRDEKHVETALGNVRVQHEFDTREDDPPLASG
ncbi:hypothetical protein C8J57DRAFT_1482905 [Mycena rebaudengoi]|nr:hypothetical protein C8J57DRAFT_1482905 [Mycena rebaudengoi]